MAWRVSFGATCALTCVFRAQNTLPVCVLSVLSVCCARTLPLRPDAEFFSRCGSVGAGFTPIIPPLWRAVIPLVSSLVATSSSSSSLLGVECLGDRIRFGCHRSIHLAFVECIHNFLNRNFRTRLKNLNCNCIGGRKSRINVILEDNVGYCFFGASELSGDAKQFGKVGIERLTGSGAKSAEFPKERHSSDGGVGSVCACFEFFPYLNWIVRTFDVYFDSIGTGTIDVGQGLQFPLLVVLIPWTVEIEFPCHLDPDNHNSRL